MTNDIDRDIDRSKLFAELIRRREDDAQRRVIEKFKGKLIFEPIDELMISSAAWKHVKDMGLAPKLVFAHPDLLQAHSKTSIYYRGIALIPRKRGVKLGVNLKDWEEGKNSKPIQKELATKVARLYNTVISTIIEGSSDWTLENGYRNITATMGITLDGMFRNRIGDQAEELVKSRIASWLKDRDIVAAESLDDEEYELPNATVMRFGSEPDIEFKRSGQLIATIEIKGGRDPAGALERLGAMTKSFAETPTNCVNFLVAGIITQEMQSRLDTMGNVKVYELDDITSDGESWDDFTNEVFHHALRVI